MNDKPQYDPPRQSNYETALTLAKDRLSNMDFSSRCEKAGASLTGSGAVIKLIDRLYNIDGKSFEITPADEGPPPEIWEKIIILHYLITATGSEKSGRLISYKEVPDGAPYVAVFHKRTSGILLSVFGEKLSEFQAAANKLGAEEVGGYGDMALSVPALPRVSYLFVCYEPDEEFEPEIRVLFDSSIQGYLPAEDITVLCQMICIKMVRGK